jgi:predicted PolB exonuclease-like 3'-5' exonuclease
MRFKDLKQDDFDLIKKTYNKSESRKSAQKTLSKYFNVSRRTIREWAKRMLISNQVDKASVSGKILVYDIETSRAEFKLFWTGKQYVPVGAMKKEPKIISISWKWLGEDNVSYLAWDKNQSDEGMLKTFLKEYNKADMVIGQNNDRFDNRWINARASKFDLEVNTFVRSFDIMKQNKRLFRLPSYSMKFCCEYYGVPQKLEHEGIKMWDMIEDGTKEEQAEYLQKMIDYNIGDIISTEALYYRLRKYYGHKIHLGVSNGQEKWTSPSNGSYNVNLYKTTVTPAGTIQRIMISNDDGVKYRISNKVYMDYLDYKIKNSSYE